MRFMFSCLTLYAHTLCPYIHLSLCLQADYTRALALEPRNPFALYNRGISHDRSGDYEAAIRDFSAAIELLPSNADFFHNRGFCYRKLGDFAAAVVRHARLRCLG